MRDRVMAIDDNFIERNLLKARFLIADVDFDLFSDPFQALNHLEYHQNYKLILVDLRMDGLNGFEFTQEMARRFQNTVTPPVVAVAACALSDDREACQNAGIAGYLAKPYSQDDFESMIWPFIRGHLPAPVSGIA